MQQKTYFIEHTTRYNYQNKLDYNITSLHLQPLSSSLQTVHTWKIEADGDIKQEEDGLGNICHYFSVHYPTTQIVISASGNVTSFNRHIIQQNKQDIDASFYLRSTNICDINSSIQKFTLDNTKDAITNYDKAIKLMQALYNKLQYTSYTTNIFTKSSDVYKSERGVCQDYAHLYLSCIRSLNIPARYVSGYFFSPQPNLASHAWVDVLISDNEWLSLDVTHNTVTNHHYIRLATGTDYHSVCPVKGVQFGGVDEDMKVEISINPIDKM